MDESTDNSNVVQLCNYVHFFDVEDLLGLIPLEGHTTGETSSTNTASFFEESTDGQWCTLDGRRRTGAGREDGNFNMDRCEYSGSPCVDFWGGLFYF